MFWFSIFGLLLLLSTTCFKGSIIALQGAVSEGYVLSTALVKVRTY